MSRDRFSPYEFALVMAMGFGASIVYSIYVLVNAPLAYEQGARDTFSTAGLLRLITLELICLPAIAGLLYFRGWRLRDFPIGIGRLGTLLGVAVFAAAWAADEVMQLVLGGLFPVVRLELAAFDTYKPYHPPDLVVVYLASLVNPVYEEVLVCGYVMAALAPRFGATAAINTSVVIRASYHLYQGVAALPFHVLYGLLQAYLYARFGKLWPLIVSHALLDFVAFVALIYR